MNSKEFSWNIRRYAIEMTHRGNTSHIASIMSIADILGVLYNDVANISPENFTSPLRDRVILSKGHAGAGIYISLALKGFMPMEELMTHAQNGSRLSAHVSHRGVDGVEISTGSLGHGLSVGCGMALAGKMNKQQYRVFVIMGDGECDEGSVWEAVMFANQFKLDNLTLIVDHNKMQSLTWCESTIALEPLDKRFASFGWQTLSIDGHNHQDLLKAFNTPSENQKPKCIIANTIKGKGISFMENNIAWHYRSPQEETYQQAIEELQNSKPTK